MTARDSNDRFPTPDADAGVGPWEPERALGAALHEHICCGLELLLSFEKAGNAHVAAMLTRHLREAAEQFDLLFGDAIVAD